jgi:hypothetical protein
MIGDTVLDDLLNDMAVEKVAQVDQVASLAMLDEMSDQDLVDTYETVSGGQASKEAGALDKAIDLSALAVLAATPALAAYAGSKAAKDGRKDIGAALGAVGGAVGFESVLRIAERLDAAVPPSIAKKPAAMIIGALGAGVGAGVGLGHLGGRLANIGASKKGHTKKAAISGLRGLAGRKTVGGVAQAARRALKDAMVATKVPKMRMPKVKLAGLKVLKGLPKVTVPKSSGKRSPHARMRWTI